MNHIESVFDFWVLFSVSDAAHITLLEYST
jgi:hypothetical protein